MFKLIFLPPTTSTWNAVHAEVAPNSRVRPTMAASLTGLSVRLKYTRESSLPRPAAALYHELDPGRWASDHAGAVSMLSRPAPSAPTGPDGTTTTAFPPNDSDAGCCRSCVGVVGFRDDRALAATDQHEDHGSLLTPASGPAGVPRVPVGLELPGCRSMDEGKDGL